MPHTIAEAPQLMSAHEGEATHLQERPQKSGIKRYLGESLKETSEKLFLLPVCCTVGGSGRDAALPSPAALEVPPAPVVLNRALTAPRMLPVLAAAYSLKNLRTTGDHNGK